jgi:hypothetical protein
MKGNYNARGRLWGLLFNGSPGFAVKECIYHGNSQRAYLMRAGSSSRMADSCKVSKQGGTDKRIQPCSLSLGLLPHQLYGDMHSLGQGIEHRTFD